MFVSDFFDELLPWLSQTLNRLGGEGALGETSKETPVLKDLLTIVKGFRNGLVYGTKIRLPHALVMTFLFRDDPFWEKIRIISRLTKKHALNLACFVTIYKSLLMVFRRVASGKDRPWHTLLAGGIGGYLVFSSDNPVNNQIVLYLLARVATALVKLLYNKYIIGQRGATSLLPAKGLGEDSKAFKVEATLVWALVMYLFRYHADTLQSSLRSSMQYLYNDSDHWHSLWTLLIHNK